MHLRKARTNLEPGATRNWSEPAIAQVAQGNGDFVRFRALFCRQRRMAWRALTMMQLS